GFRPLKLRPDSQATIRLPCPTSRGDWKLLRRGNRQCKARCPSRTATKLEELCHYWHKARQRARETRALASKCAHGFRPRNLRRQIFSLRRRGHSRQASDGPIVRSRPPSCPRRHRLARPREKCPSKQ